jgi:hypothetical protein
MTTKTNVNDVFVPDPVFARELGVTLMTIWRCDHDEKLAELDWPAKITIRNRNFRSRQQIEKYKSGMVRRAMAQRRKFVAA